MYIFVKANEYGVDFIKCADKEEEIKRVFIAEICNTIEDELERGDILDDIDKFLDSVGEKGDYDCYADAIYDGGHYHEFLDWLYRFKGVNVNGGSICSFGSSEEGQFFEFSWYNSDDWMVHPKSDENTSYSDEQLKRLWEEFGDIPMDPETEQIEAPFLHFKAGTNRKDIWHWFDERYSAGVYYLLYPGKLDRIAEMIDERVQKELHYDTDNITNKGWDFIENQAPRICIRLILDDYDENELSDINEEDVYRYFNKALEKSEFKLRENN